MLPQGLGGAQGSEIREELWKVTGCAVDRRCLTLWPGRVLAKHGPQTGTGGDWSLMGKEKSGWRGSTSVWE